MLKAPPYTPVPVNEVVWPVIVKSSESVSLLLTRLLIWSAKMFFSNKHVSAYLSGIKDYSKFSW